MFRALFLDRDGVVIENRSEYVRSWSDVEFFPSAIQALSKVQGYKVVIATNQSAVGRGLISLATANEINARFANELRNQGAQVDAVYLCPHAPEDQCSCRKPAPGMLLQAAKDLSLDLSQSWMIGDAWSDLLAGQAAGVKHVALLRTGRGQSQLLMPQPEQLDNYFVFNDLLEALNQVQKFDSASSE